MNRRLVTVFLFAVMVASLTSFALYQLILVRMRAPVDKPVGTTRLVVAFHDIQVGALLKDADLTETLVSGPVADSAIKTKADAIGRGVIANIYQNEPILSTRLAAKGAGAGLAATIPIGMRALALPVNEVVGLAGFVSPGMRVDVLVAGSVENSEGNNNTFCRTILQNIEVLSAGQKVERNIEGKPESAQVVNLLVTPTQAETLNLASGQTKVQLVLRNPLDTQEATTTGISLAKLFGKSEAPAPKPVVVAARASRPPTAPVIAKQPETGTIEVFNGTKKSEMKFEAAGAQ